MSKKKSKQLIKNIYKKKRKVFFLNHILYIIAKVERKWIPTIKEVMTNGKKDPLKCCHVYSFKIKIVARYNVRLLKSLPRLQLKQIK